MTPLLGRYCQNLQVNGASNLITLLKLWFRVARQLYWRLRLEFLGAVSQAISEPGDTLPGVAERTDLFRATASCKGRGTVREKEIERT